MKKTTKKYNKFSDWIFAALAYLILLIIDPLTATVIGAPISAVAFFFRNRWWPSRPIAGGAVMFLLVPICSIGLAFLFTLGSPSLFLGNLLAFLSLGVAEVVNRRAGRSFVRRFTITCGLFFFLLSFVFTVLLLETGFTSYPTEEFVKKVSHATEASSWSVDSKGEAIAAVARVIDLGADEIDKTSGLYRELSSSSANLLEESSPYGVYVTLYEKTGYRSRGSAIYGRDSLDKIIRAASEAIGQESHKPRKKSKRRGRWRASSLETRIQIDVAGPPQRITARPFFYIFAELLRGADSSLQKLEPLGDLLNLAFQVESGVDGLIVRNAREERTATILPSDPVTYGWFTPRVRSAPGKMRTMIHRAWRRNFGENLDLEKEDWEVIKFRTKSFGALAANEPVIDWYRGNTLTQKDPTSQELVARIEMTSEWLRRQVKKSGEFAYEKYPPYKDSTSSYNLPRHAGSVYGLFAMFALSLEEPRLEKAGIRAMDAGLAALKYIGENLKTPKNGRPGDLCFLDEKNRAASGSTALAAMSVAEIATPDQVADPITRERIEAVPKKEWMTRMGQCMLQMIDDTGAVYKNYLESQTQDRVIEEPLYYPGEVMLALTRIYKKTEDERFLEGAKKIGRRQHRIYKWPLFFDFPVPGDHWIIQALAELAVVTGERDWAELAVLMGRGYLREQHPPQAFLYPDYKGGYKRIADLPRTTRAASRGEALGGAIKAARFLDIDTDEFENGLIQGARHLLEQQFTPENSYFVPAEWDVVGGIRMGLVDNHLRIDNNQHALVALIHTLEAMER